METKILTIYLFSLIAYTIGTISLTTPGVQASPAKDSVLFIFPYILLAVSVISLLIVIKRK
tara:strand:+ start:221 stop:403 length:183 start_codon:yes stop_codon:yes gene_type:complete